MKHNPKLWHNPIKGSLVYEKWILKGKLFQLNKELVEAKESRKRAKKNLRLQIFLLVAVTLNFLLSLFWLFHPFCC